MDSFKRQSLIELVQINMLVSVGFTMKLGRGGACKVEASTSACYRPQAPEGKVLESPWRLDSVESGRGVAGRTHAASVLGGVLRGHCPPGVFPYGEASWPSTWQACCLGRIPFFCIHQSLEEAECFYHGWGRETAQLRVEVDSTCAVPRMSVIQYGLPGCQVTRGGQES